MALVPVVCYRCTECNRLYAEQPERCFCARQVYIKGERFGPFIVDAVHEQYARVKCILCDSFCSIHYTNLRKQQSCGCKPRYIEPVELTEHVLTYRCKRCDKVTSARLPILSYCCEEEDV